jgi:glycosyltransferase involved in cell wall biosynthesis
MPKLSIITINYNNSAGLKKTITSVLSQSFNNYEYIIIDGGSTDDSPALIKEIDHRLSYWDSEKDNGVYDAMNKGINNAVGDYIMILNSGDYLIHENVLLDFDKQAAYNNAAIYFGNIRLEDTAGVTKEHTYPSVLTLDFWEHYTINHQACFLKTSLFKELGLYDTSYKLAADYAFFIKCFVAGKNFEHINKELVNYNLAGTSSVNVLQYQQERQRAWVTIVPAFIMELYQENKSNRLLMKHRMMLLAKNIQAKYSRLKKIFS